MRPFDPIMFSSHISDLRICEKPKRASFLLAMAARELRLLENFRDYEWKIRVANIRIREADMGPIRDPLGKDGLENTSKVH